MALIWHQGSFNRINSDRSIPTIESALTPIEECNVSIVSIQTDQSRLKKLRRVMTPLKSFNRINSDRSIPTSQEILTKKYDPEVSIVSIQTDQSRHGCHRRDGYRSSRVSIVSIQTDQSRRLQISRLWYSTA